MEFEQILKLIDAVSDSELASFVLERDGARLSMTTEKCLVPGAGGTIGESQEQKLVQVQRVEQAQETDSGSRILKAPLVGTFYAAPSEDAAPFVKAGDQVKKGQVLGIIEAMKLMNEIESEYDGVVEAILVENEQVVEYGQPLFRIR